MTTEQSFEADPPTLIEFDTSTVCNLKCLTCMRARPDYISGPPQFLSLQNFRTVIDKIPCLHLVQFCGASEPTLNRDLPDMIAYAKQRGAEVVEMFTNGTLLTGQVADRLAESGLDQLKVSIDGGTQEDYRRVRGFDLERVISYVSAFHQRCPIPLGVESVLSTHTAGSIIYMPDVVKRMGGTQLEVRLLNWVDPNIPEHAIYDPRRLATIKSGLEDKCRQLDIQLTMPLPEAGDCNYCTTGSELYVNYQGDVTPCYFLNHTPIGNLVAEPYQDVWNGEAIKTYRANFANGMASPDCCCSRGLILNKKVLIA